MQLALILGFCLALASARLPGLDEWSRSDDLESDPTTCQVSSRKVSTFDNVKLPINLPNCYTVLSKDCSSDPKYVVLMRKLSPNSERKQVKILTKSHKIVLTPSEHSDTIQVIVNDQLKQLDRDLELTVPGHPIIRIIKESQQQVKVECLTNGLKLRFDGNVCDIKVQQVSHNKQCGLCGLTKLELNSKFRSNDFFGTSDSRSNNQFSTTPDVRHLFAKYVTSDCSYSQTEEQCTGINCPYKRSSSLFWPESEDNTCDEINCPYKQQSSKVFSDDFFERSPRRVNDDIFNQDSEDVYTDKHHYTSDQQDYTSDKHRYPTDKQDYTSDKHHYPSDKQDYTSDKQDYTSGQRRPLLKHKIVKREDEVCISLEPIPQCPVNSHPERKVEKRVPYKCVSRNDQRVRQLESRIRNGEQIPELQRLTPSLTRTEVVPVTCSSVY